MNNKLSELASHTVNTCLLSISGSKLSSHLNTVVLRLNHLSLTVLMFRTVFDKQNAVLHTNGPYFNSMT